MSAKRSKLVGALIVFGFTGKDLPPHRPRKIFDRQKVVELAEQGLSLRHIAKRMGIGLGTVSRTLQQCSKS